MASIKDALEESFQDNGALIKFFIFSIPLFIVINYRNFPAYEILLGFTVILLLGFMMKCTYNVRSGNMTVLPSYNIIPVLWTGFVGLLVLAPAALGGYFASKFIVSYAGNYVAAENILKIIEYICYAIFSSFVLTIYLLYTNKFKIKDAYNLNLISKYCIDILLAVVFMLIQVALIDSLILAPITYLIWIFFGIPHPVGTFFWCVVGVLNLAMLGHYMGQVSYEIIEIKEKNKEV